MFGKTSLLLNKLGIKRLLIMALPLITIIGLTLAVSGDCAGSLNGMGSCWQ